uniref:Poly(A) polymerase n=1 Tax=Cucumis melo subsp. melo TaxID=412675 RepID=E5GBM4_CUCME|nr:poly(A) polymerase [Cucumis melo subsp. melo]
MSSSTSRPYHHLHSPLFRFVPKADAYVHPKPPPLPTHFPESNDDDSKLRNWKRFSSNHLGIVTSMIPKPTRKVLNGLKKAGYEVYLVGGCVRDLILDRPPKDFDIITSAQLKEVSRIFLWCEIVGRRFPICHVHIDGTIVEVSSFSTSSKPFDRHLNSAAIEKSMNCEEIDFVRWKNCLQRDFTINGMMYDPYNNVVYDYLGGMEDIRQAKARLQMEMNYLLSYGSAEASLRLLWKYGLLEILLPIQIGLIHLESHFFGFSPGVKRSQTVLSYRVAVLALHVALSDQPRSPLVVATFGLAVHNGGNMMEAISIAKSINRAHNANFYELLEPQNMEVQALIDEVMDLTTSVKVALHKMTDEHFVSLALESYPQAPASDLVFIPLVVYLKVCKIFECVVEGAERGFVPKRGKINYECLALGNVPELRHVFARIVFDTVYPL